MKSGITFINAPESNAETQPVKIGTLLVGRKMGQWRVGPKKIHLFLRTEEALRSE